MTCATSKFDATRAADYAVQSRIALAGYDACHDLAASLLSALLGHGSAARIVVIGAGGSGLEVLSAGRLERNWHFTAVDPSPPMNLAPEIPKGMCSLTDSDVKLESKKVCLSPLFIPFRNVLTRVLFDEQFKEMAAPLMPAYAAEDVFAEARRLSR